MIIRVLIQTVLIALSQLWANGLRALLTTLGIVIGVAATVSTIAATQGLRSYVLDQFATFGANKVWIFPHFPDNQRDKYSWRQVRITPTQINGVLGSCPSIARITPIMEMTLGVSNGERSKGSVKVTGIRPDWHTIETRSVTVGRQFNETDEKEHLNVCLINDKGVEEMSLNADPTGTTILVGDRRFTIIGVVETRAVSPMFGGDEAKTEIYIPFGTALVMQPEPRMYAVAQTRAPELYDDAKAEVTMYMRRVRHLNPDEPNTFGVEALNQVIDQFKSLSTSIQVGMGFIVAISLFVGGVGIMNIMFVSVSERTREIGLRKAMGARPDVILLQFLVEAVVLCGLGGLMGMAIGQSIVLAARAALPKVMAGAIIPLWAVIVAVGVSVVVGLVSGLFPAIKAARLDPIAALRHE